MRYAIAMLATVAVGACSPAEPAQAPDDSVDIDALLEPEPSAEPSSDEEPREDDEAATSSEPAETQGSEPEFREGMSVDEAIAAVPPDADRLNIEQEALEKPLANSATYEPCNLKPHEHFTLRVAIWNGRAVGTDITTAPKNAKLEECLKGVVRELIWPDKVKSLNTVQYQF